MLFWVADNRAKNQSELPSLPSVPTFLRQV
jgi:hypothetical protein